MTLPELTDNVRLIYNKLNFLLERDISYIPDMPYVLFAIIPCILLIIMYICNGKLEKLINQKKDKNKWHWVKFVTSFSLLLSFFLISFYFLYIYFERNHNIKLSLSVLLLMFSGWFISGVFSKVEFEDTLTKVNDMRKKIKKLKTKDSLDEILTYVNRIKIDLHKFSIQGQIITTMIVLLSLFIYAFSVGEYIFTGLTVLLILIIGMGFIPSYRDLFEKEENTNKEFNRTTTLYFLWFSLENSPALKKSFLVPRALSVIAVYTTIQYKRNRK